MNRSKKHKRAFALVALCLLAVGGAGVFAQRQLAGQAQGRPEVKIVLAGAVQRGGDALPLEKVSAVKPGEVLHWDITSMNEGDGPAREYKTVGHIPPGTSFVAGSAAAEKGSTVTYSIDGGKTFSTLPLVEEKQPDGTVKQVPAPVSMYTEVRYEWQDELAAGGKLSASYKVRVK
jgi:uncharacterized repeat protein (TIGR01451 family)